MSQNILLNNDEKFDDNLNIKENDSSFNQLAALQLLIQKHSGIKELCK